MPHGALLHEWRKVCLSSWHDGPPCAELRPRHGAAAGFRRRFAEEKPGQAPALCGCGAFGEEPLGLRPQLVEGAYRYAGLEINTASYQCTTEQRLMPGSLIPATISLCGPLRIIEDIAPEHLKLSVDGYNGGFLGIGSYWKIAVYNPYSYEIPFQYNSKMCFDGDAENWSGLYDVKNEKVGGYKTKVIKVYTNFAADAIAFSRLLDVWTPNGYCYSSVRHITYAKNLNSATNRLTERYNIKDRQTVFNYYDSH